MKPPSGGLYIQAFWSVPHEAGRCVHQGQHKPLRPVRNSHGVNARRETGSRARIGNREPLFPVPIRPHDSILRCPPGDGDASAPDLSGVKTVAGEYHQQQLSDVMRDKGRLTADIVRTWQERWGRDKTLCFAVDLAHARQLHERFSRSGIKCAYQDADTPGDVREALRQQFNSGEVQVARASPSRLPQPPRSLTVPSPPPASTLAAATPRKALSDSALWRCPGLKKRMGEACTADLAYLKGKRPAEEVQSILRGRVKLGRLRAGEHY
jgi:hypothetical protein